MRPPEKELASTVGAVEAPEEHSSISNQHSDARTPAEQAEHRYQNLRARAALIGVEVYRTADERRPLFVVRKWAVLRTIEGLDALAEWMRRADGRSE